MNENMKKIMLRFGQMPYDAFNSFKRKMPANLFNSYSRYIVNSFLMVAFLFV